MATAPISPPISEASALARSMWALTRPMSASRVAPSWRRRPGGGGGGAPSPPVDAGPAGSSARGASVSGSSGPRAGPGSGVGRASSGAGRSGSSGCPPEMGWAVVGGPRRSYQRPLLRPAVRSARWPRRCLTAALRSGHGRRPDAPRDPPGGAARDRHGAHRRRDAGHEQRRAGAVARRPRRHGAPGREPARRPGGRRGGAAGRARARRPGGHDRRPGPDTRRPHPRVRRRAVRRGGRRRRADAGLAARPVGAAPAAVPRGQHEAGLADPVRDDAAQPERHGARVVGRPSGRRADRDPARPAARDAADVGGRGPAAAGGTGRRRRTSRCARCG